MNLRAMREGVGLTQDEAAAATGLHQSTFSQLELGNIPSPRVSTLEALATAYGKSLDEILQALRASISEAA